MKTSKKAKINLPAAKLPVEHEPRDFRSSYPWRVLRIMSEFVDGWQFLADFDKTITIFGSARTNENDKWYKVARKLGNLLGDKGFSVVTGGGPGIMEAGNRGVFERDGESIGIDIKLPFEQRENPYITKSQGFYYFFTRKVMLAYSARAYVFFPGGYGTLDELFEMLTLLQTKKITKSIPVVLVGKEFWAPMIQWIKETFVKEYKTISPEDLDIFTVVDTAEEAFAIIKKAPERHKFDEFITSNKSHT